MTLRRATRSGTAVLVFGLSVAAWVAPVEAVDGVLEIHPACVAGGCFPGDDPGFPVEIASPGSYRLTGNLAVPDVQTTAIEVDADDVAIDLNGFTIQGPHTCTFENTFPPTLTCSSFGAGEGITVSGLAPESVRTSVRNGVVRGMGSTGIRLGEGSRIENVVVEQNGAFGATVRAGHLHHVTARLNQGSGFSRNFNTDSLLTVDSCIARRNGGDGFELASAVVRDSIASANLGTGIACGGSCTITGNQVQFNEGAGIQILSFGVVRGNTVHRNDLFGLDAGSSTAYGENSFENNNAGGPQVGGGTAFEIGTNVCDGDTTCP